MAARTVPGSGPAGGFFPVKMESFLSIMATYKPSKANQWMKLAACGSCMLI